MYYLQSRYYDPAIGRFINADVYESTGQGFIGCNMFAYCGNNPINCVDYDGYSWESIKNWFNNALTRIGQYFSDSNIYGTLVGGLAIVTQSLSFWLKKGIKTAIRPSNIGAGVFAKQRAAEIALVEGFEKSSGKLLGILGFGVAAIDVIQGIYNNRNASTKRIISDAIVDVAITGGSVWAAGVLGGKIGTAVGTIVAPGAGNVIGACAGFVIGVGFYVVTDMLPLEGKTVRQWTKEGAYSIW